MSRAAVHLCAAILTFSAGLLAHTLRPAPGPGASEPAALTVCELERDYEKYDGKLVRVAGVLGRNTSTIIHDFNYCPAVPGTSPFIEIDVEAGGVLPRWATETLFCGNEFWACQDRPGVEVLVVGTFEADGFAHGAADGLRQPAITPRIIVRIPPPAGGR